MTREERIRQQVGQVFHAHGGKILRLGMAALNPDAMIARHAFERVAAAHSPTVAASLQQQLVKKI